MLPVPCQSEQVLSSIIPKNNARYNYFTSKIRIFSAGTETSPKILVKIDAAIMKVLEMIPPELYADIAKKGVYLAGGGALLKGLDRRLYEKTNIPFHVADDPLRAVARGTGIALKNIGRFSFLMK